MPLVKCVELVGKCQSLGMVKFKRVWHLLNRQILCERDLLSRGTIYTRRVLAFGEYIGDAAAL